MDTFIDKITGKFSSGDVIKANAEAEARQLEAYKARVEELEKAVSDMRRLSLKCVETNEATGQLVQCAIEKIEEVKGESGGIDCESLEKILTELSTLKESVDSNFGKIEESKRESQSIDSESLEKILTELSTLKESVDSNFGKIEESKRESQSIDSESLEKILTELSTLKESVDSNFKKTEEESHKENVRVYRNVQAAVVDELKQQSEAIALQHVHIEKKMKGIKPIAIIALVLSGLNFCAVVFGLVIWILSMGL